MFMCDMISFLLYANDFIETKKKDTASMSIIYHHFRLEEEEEEEEQRKNIGLKIAKYLTRLTSINNVRKNDKFSLTDILVA